MTDLVPYMVQRYSIFIDQWDYELNDSSIDIYNIFCGCNTKFHWICGKCGYRWFACPNDRTKNKKYHGCRQCCIQSKRKNSIVQIEQHNENRETKKLSGLLDRELQHQNTGDKTEIYMINLLNSMNCYENIESIGNYSAESDICLVYNQFTYYIQVKTMSDRGNDVYSVHSNDRYPPNMIMLVTNSERNRFAVTLANRLTITTDLVFGYALSIYRDIMFTDIELVKNRIKELVPISCTRLTFSEKSHKLRYESLQRFITFCIQNNIPYIRNITTIPYDGTINGKRVKIKYHSVPPLDKNMYPISLAKNNGRLNGVTMMTSLEQGDIDYIIVEVGGDRDGDKTKHHNQFLFLSEQVLIDQQFIKTNTNEGKKAINVSPPDYIMNKENEIRIQQKNKEITKKTADTKIRKIKPHWDTPYWNKIPEEFLI